MSFIPIDEQAKDGFERMLRFPNGEHWGWFNKKDQKWYYKPYISNQYIKHSTEPSHYKPERYEG